MLSLRMRGPTSQDSTVPAWVLHKAIGTIVIANWQLKRRLNTVEQEARGLARPIVISVVGAAVGIPAIVGAVNKAPARLLSKVPQ